MRKPGLARVAALPAGQGWSTFVRRGVALCADDLWAALDLGGTLTASNEDRHMTAPSSTRVPPAGRAGPTALADEQDRQAAGRMGSR
jgi:hypothetical protein